MPKKYDPIDARDVVTYSLSQRQSKFDRTHLGQPHAAGNTVSDFLSGLPRVLGADDLRSLAADIVAAHREGRPVIAGMGAHVIKCGCQPYLIDWMEKGILHALAMNGAGIVHDIEMAMVGHTSEDVDASLPGGGFGMARETATELNAALKRAPELGVGRAVGQHILDEGFPFASESLLATAARMDRLATVHVALGTDIIHMHPDTDGEAIGAGTLRDFRSFASAVADLGGGGVYLNLGSAVILPEVFLKAVSLARNLGANLDEVITANLDFIRHYRTMTNVVRRPTENGGRGYNLLGHHEIMIPLLTAAVVEGIAA